MSLVRLTLGRVRDFSKTFKVKITRIKEWYIVFSSSRV